MQFFTTGASLAAAFSTIAAMTGESAYAGDGSIRPSAALGCSVRCHGHPLQGQISAFKRS